MQRDGGAVSNHECSSGLKRPPIPCCRSRFNHWLSATVPHSPRASPTDSLTRGSRGRSPLVITKGAERLSNDYARSAHGSLRSPFTIEVLPSVAPRRSSLARSPACGRIHRAPPPSVLDRFRRAFRFDNRFSPRPLRSIMGSCIICGTSTDGYICESHEEDVAFEFEGSHANQLTPGRFYRGSVDGFAEFGVFVDIGDSVTGLLHRSELDRRLESLDWDSGDTVYVQVTDVHDNGNVDLTWSIRQSEREFRGSLVDTPEGDELPSEKAEVPNPNENAAAGSPVADTDGLESTTAENRSHSDGGTHLIERNATTGPEYE